MKEPNFAAVYCCIYPELAAIARTYGYALAIHGSMARDFDLIAVPWSQDCGSPEQVVQAIVNTWAMKECGEPTLKEHGRVAYSLGILFGECAIDLSFMPAHPPVHVPLI